MYIGPTHYNMATRHWRWTANIKEATHLPTVNKKGQLSDCHTLKNVH